MSSKVYPCNDIDIDQCSISASSVFPNNRQDTVINIASDLKYTPKTFKNNKCIIEDVYDDQNVILSTIENISSNTIPDAISDDIFDNYFNDIHQYLVDNDLLSLPYRFKYIRSISIKCIDEIDIDVLISKDDINCLIKLVDKYMEWCQDVFAQFDDQRIIILVKKDISNKKHKIKRVIEHQNIDLLL